jgi:phosphatidylglycerophosphate synthase
MTPSAPADGNPRDGYIDRLVYRPLARPVIARLLPTPISANTVTFASAAVGIAGGLLVGSATTGGVILGVLCLVASGVLDCADGELARRRGTASRLGHLLDITGDTVVHAALLAGIVRRLARVGALPGWPVLVALGLGVAGAFAVITLSEATEARRHRVPGWENQVLDGILAPLTTRDWYVFPIAFALAGRLDLLLPAAAAGAHLFWICTLLLLVRVLRPGQVQGSEPRVRQ